MTSPTFGIGEFARRGGVTVHTIRYYESAGVLGPARRAANGHRRYGPSDVLWLAFVMRLKATGMQLGDIRRYAVLRSRGDATLNSRLAMLRLHRQRLASHLQELSACAQALDDKICGYEKLVAEAAPTLRRTKP